MEESGCHIMLKALYAIVSDFLRMPFLYNSRKLIHFLYFWQLRIILAVMNMNSFFPVLCWAGLDRVSCCSSRKARSRFRQASALFAFPPSTRQPAPLRSHSWENHHRDFGWISFYQNERALRRWSWGQFLKDWRCLEMVDMIMMMIRFEMNFVWKMASVRPRYTCQSARYCVL